MVSRKGFAADFDNYPNSNNETGTPSVDRSHLTSSPLVGIRPTACNTSKLKRTSPGSSMKPSISSVISVFLEETTMRSSRIAGFPVTLSLVQRTP